MTVLRSDPVSSLRGTVRVPGDKSISHRALILGALAVGETTITGLLEGADVLATAGALRALGANVERRADGVWIVRGVGVGGLAEPETVLDLGNSGTGVRLLMGAVASHPITVLFTGDKSLRSRPMERIATPLSLMGAQTVARAGCRLPLAIIGTARPMPITYRTPVPSAQVKSAVLLAALNAPGRTCVIEVRPTRDHTERLLRRFGAAVDIEDSGEGRAVSVTGEPELRPCTIDVPADPSSAAFLTVAALIRPDSEVRLTGVGMNPLRAGLYETLQEMGADFTLENQSDAGGEPVADLIVRGGAMTGVAVPATRVPAMIDEIPVLAVAAACAEGETRLEGLSELRIKESDRLAAIAAGLTACGVDVTGSNDSLVVRGTATPAGGATIDSQHDHRIAMAFLVLGMAARAPVAVTGAETIATSFPGFADLANSLGGRITQLQGSGAGPAAS
ncbi:MAG TPA: 3-phosphoshikimate 1-carboxyvinyltransferase [Alphaproteobacteria bacterium]|nr:3-phosphoshikimate 1-carboxyvinyltransferase [Alphaproteobacteria bacterium]